jgi:hypothetical protein
MAADLTGTFQYPRLYAELGAVALYADAATTADPLLRASLALDPHQPTTGVALAIAVTVQGSDASTAIAAAIDELADPLWQRTSGVTPETLRAAMTGEIQRYVSQFPARGEAVAPLQHAIDQEAPR